MSALLKNIRVGIDFDDVLVPLLGPWIKKMGEACDPPKNLGEKDWTEWDLYVLEGEKIRKGLKIREGWVTQGHEYFGTARGGPGGLDDRALTIYEFFGPDLYDNARPYPGAVEAMAALAKLPDVELLCVTAHSRSATPAMCQEIEARKKAILEEYFPALAKNVHFTSDKAALKLDALIDDGLHNISAFLEKPDAWLTPFDPNPDFKPKPKLGVLINRAWNARDSAALQEDKRAVTVDSLADAVPYVMTFAEKLAAERRQEQLKALERVPVTEITLPRPEKEKIR